MLDPHSKAEYIPKSYLLLSMFPFPSCGKSEEGGFPPASSSCSLSQSHQDQVCPSCKKMLSCLPVVSPYLISKNSETSYISYCFPPLPLNSHISNYLQEPSTVTNFPAYNKCHQTCLPASGGGLAWRNLTPVHSAVPLGSEPEIPQGAISSALEVLRKY